MRYLIVFLFALCFVACQQNDSIVPDVAKSSKEYSVSDKSVTRAIQTYREPTNEEKQVLSTDFGAGGFFRGCPLHSPNQIS